jgi:hypothetical protein
MIRNQHRTATVALLVAVLVAAAGAGVAHAQSDTEAQVRVVEDEVEDDAEPTSVRYAVNENVFVSSHEFEDGDVVVTLTSRTDGARVRLTDEMHVWAGEKQGYDEVLTLDKGVTEVRVPDVSVFDANRNRYYGIVVYEVGGDGIAAAAGSVGWSASIPLPPVGPATATATLLTALSTFAAGYLSIRRIRGQPRFYLSKPDKGLLRGWLL